MTQYTDTQILLLPTDELIPNPRQPRKFFEEESLLELAESIRRHGILQPLTVRQTENGWALIAGERRLRAARLAGLEKVPCVPVSVNENDSALLALIENIQRQNLHYFEEAAAMADFLRRSGLTQEELALRLGRSPSALANKLRLLRLGPQCREILITHGLSERHGRCLLRLENEADRVNAAAYIARHGLSVAQAEQYIERQLAALQSTPPQGRRTFILKDVRLFLNSINHGLRLMREAGVEAVSGREETEDEILLTIRIPKSPGKSSLLPNCNPQGEKSVVK